MKIKKNIPWQLKVAAKLLMGLLRVDYRFLKALKLVEHGRMEDAGFAVNVFERQMKIAIQRFPELAESNLHQFCEMGPGDSILSGVIAAMNGFAGSQLIDVGDFENTGAKAIREIFDKYGKIGEIENVSDENMKQFVKDKYNIAYHSNGLEAYKLLEDGRVSFSYSNTVLQHIAKDEIVTIFKEVFRSHKEKSISIHSVNFLDHFSGGFRNRKIPERIWESALIKRSNLYTNRLGLSDLLAIAASAGFKSAVHSYEEVGQQPVVMPIEQVTQPGPEVFSNKKIVRATLYLIK
jgi:hypothetical protein